MGKYSKLLEEILKEKCDNNFALLYKVMFADSLQCCNNDLELSGEDEDYIVDVAYSIWLDYEDFQIDDAVNKVLNDIQYIGGLEIYKAMRRKN